MRKHSRHKSRESIFTILRTVSDLARPIAIHALSLFRYWIRNFALGWKTEFVSQVGESRAPSGETKRDDTPRLAVKLV